MIYRIRHAIRMRYAKPVADARMNLRLRPAEWPGQSVSDVALSIDPPPARLHEALGAYYVNTARLEFGSELADLQIASSFRVEVAHGQLPDSGPSAADVAVAALTQRDMGILSTAPYLFASRIAMEDEEIGEWAGQSFDCRAPILDAAMALTSRVHGEFTYRPGATDSRTSPREAFEKRHGVCQDFAHVLITGLRWLGIPAAYASGYLRTLPPPGQAKLVGADAMHAWVNVWCGPELGWIGVDPTNDCVARDNHIQIAMGRDYADIAPIDGTFIGSAPQALTSSVDVDEVG